MSLSLDRSKSGGIRFSVQSRDVPPEHAARRIGLSLAQFVDLLPRLVSRGFPQIDPDTGNFDLQAIDRWMDSRHSHLFSEVGQIGPRDAHDVVAGRLAAMRSARGRG